MHQSRSAILQLVETRVAEGGRWSRNTAEELIDEKEEGGGRTDSSEP